MENRREGGREEELEPSGHEKGKKGIRRVTGRNNRRKRRRGR